MRSGCSGSWSCPIPDAFGNRYPHQVSGGQLQRAMAAMAMIAKPDLLVFDEPTTALDVTTQVEVLASFKKLIREHRTAALYITHDLAVVAQIADRIMVLRRGKMVEHGAGDPDPAAAADGLHPHAGGGAGGRRAEQVRREPRRGRPADPARSRTWSPPIAARSKVIDDVSIDLRRGDTLAIVGESGSGKSTLARVIVGLLPREQGDVLFDGTSLKPRLQDRSKDQLRRIQMIYQMPDVALNPRQTLLDIIGRPVQFYFGKSRAEVRARVEELMRQIDLPAGLHHPPAARIVGRPEAARLHRPRAGGEARHHHLRRGDVGAGSRWWRRRSCACCGASRTRPASPSCSSPTTSARCAASPTRSR